MAQELYILHGYQPPANGKVLAARVRGLFTLHNPTANVWPHVLALVWVVSRAARLLSLPAGSVPPEARWTYCLWLVCAALVLGVSTVALLFASVVSAVRATMLWEIDKGATALRLEGPMFQVCESHAITCLTCLVAGLTRLTCLTWQASYDLLA